MAKGKFRLTGKGRSYVPGANWKRYRTTGIQLAANAIGSWYKKRKAARAATEGGFRKKARTASKTGFIKRGLAHQEGSSTSMTKCNFGYNKLYSDLNKFSAPVYYTRNDAGLNVQSAIGQQAAFSVMYLSANDLIAMANKVQGMSAANLSTTKFIVERLYAESIMANASVYTTNLTIYDILIRRDCCTANTVSPAQMWSSGVTDEGGSYTNIGSEPFDSELFNQYCKVIQKTQVDIPSGGTHRHCCNWEPNKVAHQEIIKQLYTGADNGGYMDLSVASLFVLHGQPAHDSTTITQVTISAASLDICNKVEIKYRADQNSTAVAHYTNSLGGAFTVGPQIVNDLVGQVQDALGTGLHPTTLLA